MLPAHAHASGVQSVASWSVGGRHFLASVDAFGTLLTTRLPNEEEEEEEEEEAPSAAAHRTARLATESVESGWAGIAVSPEHQRVVVAQHFDRTISCVDLAHSSVSAASSSSSGGRYLSTRPTGGPPTDLAFLGTSGNCLAVTEGNAVSLWDLRCAPSSSSSSSSSAQFVCAPRNTSRHCPSSTQLLALCAPARGTDWPGGELLVAGEDRFVYTIDPRKWRVRSRWRTPLKYEPAAMFRSPSHPSLCYVAGMDNDIMCGEANPGKSGGGMAAAAAAEMGKRKRAAEGRDFALTKLTMMHQTGFRGDAPWCGMVVTPFVERGVQSDLLVAVSSSAALYVVQNASKLAVVRENN